MTAHQGSTGTMLAHQRTVKVVMIVVMSAIALTLITIQTLSGWTNQTVSGLCGVSAAFFVAAGAVYRAWAAKNARTVRSLKLDDDSEGKQQP